MIRDIESARRMSQPSAESLISHLPDMGESLNTAAVDLHRDWLKRQWCTCAGRWQPNSAVMYDESPRNH